MVTSSATPLESLPRKLYDIHWDYDDPASPALIDPLIDNADDQLEAQERAALKAYLLSRILSAHGVMAMGSIDAAIVPFLDGYRVGKGRQTPQEAGIS